MYQESHEEIEGFDFFSMLPELSAELSTALSLLRTKDSSGLTKVESLQKKILYFCSIQDNTDGIIATIHLTERKSPLEQIIFSAVLAAMLVNKLDYSPHLRASTINAILTANITFIDYQVLLNHTGNKLGEAQRQKITQHPLDAFNLLKESGIEDKIWLEIVLQHHEKLDGSGYPQNLQGDEILEQSLIVSLCDFYTAMINPKAYRSSMTAPEALRNLYAEASIKEKEIQIILLKIIGVYPVGTFVKLANDEIAIVCRKNGESVMPIVKAIADPNGKFYLGPIVREPNNPQYKIKSAHNLTKRPSMDLSAIWSIHSHQK